MLILFVSFSSSNKLRTLLPACCFFNAKFFSSKVSRECTERIGFSERIKAWPWKSLFNSYFTLLFEWVSCKNHKSHGLVLLLKYWIYFKWLYFSVIIGNKNQTFFRNIRMLSAQIIIKSRYTNGENKSTFVRILKKNSCNT